MLTGILVPTAGTVRACGMHPVSQRKELARRIGVVLGQRSQLWWDLPLRQSYRTLAAIHRLERAAWSARQDELVDRLDLAPFLSKERMRVFLAEQRATHDTTLLLTTRDMTTRSGWRSRHRRRPLRQFWPRSVGGLTSTTSPSTSLISRTSSAASTCPVRVDHGREELGGEGVEQGFGIGGLELAGRQGAGSGPPRQMDVCGHRLWRHPPDLRDVAGHRPGVASDHRPR